MYISKSRFINWTRCPMYFAMELKHNPTAKDDIEVERERREEILGELAESVKESNMGDAGFSDEEDEQFDNAPSPELEALLPYYSQVEDEALKVAKKYFNGTFQSQKLFEYKHNGNTYRCYVDIYNENDQEINIIEVKATTNSKYIYKEVPDFKTVTEMIEYGHIKGGDNKQYVYLETRKKERVKSFNEVWYDTVGLGQYLYKNGLEGKKVAILSENSYYWIACFYALMTGRYVTIPLDAKLTDADILVLLSDIDGLYDDNPNTNPDAKLIDLVEEINEDREQHGKKPFDNDRRPPEEKTVTKSTTDPESGVLAFTFE